MSYSSDEDEVPVVYLTEDYDDDVMAGPPLGHKSAAPVVKRRSRRKRPSDRERPDKLHRTSSGRRRKSETPMRLHKLDTPPPLSAQQHMHPQAVPKESEVPHAFRLGGSLIDRAKAIFNPPPPAHTAPQTASNAQQPSAGVRRTSPPPYNNGNQNSYRHRANESWQSYRPEIRLNGGGFASGRTTPGLAFDAFDMDNGITDPPPPLAGYGGDFKEFKDPFFKEEMAELKNEEAKLAAEKKDLAKEKKAPPPPKTYMQMLTELHPAVYFSLILGGLLIVRQRDDIEEYLQEGIGVFFNVVNAMVVIVTVIGAGLFIINFIAKRRPASAEPPKAAPAATAGEASKEGAAKDGSPTRGSKPLEDLMENGYYDFGIPNYGGGPNSVLGGMRNGGGGAYDSMLPGGMGLGVRGGLPGGGLGSAFAPYDDIGYSQNGSPPPHLGYPRAQTIGGRSLSIPAILNPKPVRPNQDAFYVGGMPSGRRSPTSVPVFDPNQGLKPGGSYFPSYDGGMGFGGRQVRGLETPVIAPGGFPSMRMNNRPSPIVNMGDKFDKFLPMNMPSPAKIRDPKRSTFYDDETMSMASRMTPEVQFEKRGKDEPKGFTNPKKILFTHREQTPVIKELEEDDASTIRLDNPNNHSYTDEFACKPYGPPPKRYNGINV